MRTVVLLLLVAAFLGVARGEKIMPIYYPHYAQCDSRWGHHLMGGNDTKTDTICVRGGLISTLAMALAGKGYNINDKPVTPETLNQWLRETGAYKCRNDDCNFMRLSTLNLLARGSIIFLSHQTKPPLELLQTWLVQANPVTIAHVQGHEHTVLLTGYDSTHDNFIYVNDPASDIVGYAYTQITDAITYTILDNN